MPNIESAKKRDRSAKARAARRVEVAHSLTKMLKGAFKGAVAIAAEKASELHSAIDRAAGKRIIHKNTAARLKRRVSLATK
jgi:ribosomal protein S20